MITKKDRQAALLINREQERLISLGANAAARHTLTVLGLAIYAYRRKQDPRFVIAKAVMPIKNLLVQSMVTAHLRGKLRTQIEQRKELILAGPSNAYSFALDFLKRRLGLTARELAALQAVYDTEALRITRNTSIAIERRVQLEFAKTTEQGLHVEGGIDAIQRAFAKAGILPRNKGTFEQIFRTQTQIAYSAGRWQASRDPETEDILWGYKYTAVGDERTRPSHRALDGTTLPKDHPLWKTIFPPNGYNCRCQAIPIYEEREMVVPPNTIKEDGITYKVEPDEGFFFNPGELFAPLAA